MRYDSSSVLLDCEVLLVEVREEIAPSQHFHYDVDIILVLKYIEELDDVRMLADLKHFDFSFQ